MESAIGDTGCSTSHVTLVYVDFPCLKRQAEVREENSVSFPVCVYRSRVSAKETLTNIDILGLEGVKRHKCGGTAKNGKNT